MKKLRSAEEFLAEVEKIITSYREQRGNEYSDDTILLASAISRFHDLGIKEGEALRWLKPHLKGT